MCTETFDREIYKARIGGREAVDNGVYNIQKRKGNSIILFIPIYIQKVLSRRQ